MSEGMVYQRWVTLSGDNSSDYIIQEFSRWLDTSGYRRLIVSARVETKTNATLTLETADAEVGPWTTGTTINATGVTYLEADSGAAAPLERFVRWKVAASNTNWEICFWIAVELKTS